MSITIGEAGELGLAPEILIGFLDREWKRKLCLAYPEFYRWQFIGAPAAGGHDHSIVAMDDNGDVQGFMGVTPRPFWLDGEQRKGAELTTWIVSPLYQGTSAAVNMLKDLHRRYEVMVGNSPTGAALSIYARMGWLYSRSLPRYARIPDPDRVAEICQLEPLGRKLIKSRSRLRAPAPDTAEEIDLSRGLAEGESLGRRFNGMFRDSAHIAWRYARHPVYSYRGFALTKGDSRCELVLRVDQTGSLKVLHLLEILGDDNAIAAVPGFLDRFGRDESIQLMDVHCATERIGYHFWSRGWFSILDDTFIRIPHLFYPVETRPPCTPGLILWTNRPESSFADRSRLYVTKGDADMDRPTQTYFDVHGLPEGMSSLSP